MKKEKEKEVLPEFNVGDIVDLYFYGEIFEANTPIVKVMDYENGLFRYQVLNFLVSSNNIKKSE